MSGDQKTRNERPELREHPEQQRQEETGREDPTEPGEVGRPPVGREEESKGEKVA